MSIIFLPNDILEQSDFEALRLYDPNSQLHHEISAKLRQIFRRLFQNTDINLDDFYFTGYDDDDPNAFFIESSKTKNGKNIIAVSFGLITALSNTEELAAIIGHESGHYLWSQLLGGRNTIFQERAADLRSVDLMINAGYNPRNVISAEKKIFGPLSYHSPTLNVHGNSFNRIEDVKTYLTKLSLERGYFPEVTQSDQEYQTFKQKLTDIRKKEPYLSFLQKYVLKEFCGSTDIKKIPRDKLFLSINFYLNNLCETKIRLQDLVELYKNLDYERNPKTDAEKEELEYIFNKLVERSNDNPNIEPYLWQILRYSRLSFFGCFNLLHNYIQDLINDTSWDRHKTAQTINKYAAYIPLAPELTDFTDHIIEFVPTPDIVGKKPFWIRLKEMNDPEINKALSLVTQRHTRMLIYNENDYIYDEDGNIIAYGPERDKIVQEQRDNDNIKKINELIDNYTLTLTNLLNKYNKIQDFLDGKVDPKEMEYNFVMYSFADWVKIPQLPTVTLDELSLINKYIDKIDKNKFLNIYNAIVSSAYYRDYRTYCQTTKPADSSKPIINAPMQLPPDTTNSDIFYKITELSGRALQQELTGYNVFKAYLKMAEYYEHTKAPKLEDRLYTHLINAVSSNQYGNDALPQVKEYIDKTLPQYASKNAYFCAGMPDIIVNSIVADINENNNKQTIQNIINAFGFKRPPKTEQELLFIINQLKQYNANWPDPKEKDDLYYELCAFNPIQQYDMLPTIHDGELGAALLVTYMSSGYKCNPINIIKLFGDSYVSLTEYKQILAKDISHEKFDAFNLDEKIYLYEFMDANGGFSQEAANKNYFIKKIVDEILTYPDYDIAIKYAESILMRKNIKYKTNHKNNIDLEFANEREKLIEFYAEYWAKQLGRDDNSPEFAEHAKDLADFLNYEKAPNSNDTVQDNRPFQSISFLQKKNKRNFSKMIAGALADRIANKIYAQENVTKILDHVNDRTISGNDAEKYDYFGRYAESVFNELARTPERALASIEFINSELTDKSVDTILQKFEKNNNGFIHKQSLTILHENFWAADLPIRAYLMNRLLNAYSTNDDNKLQLILDMFFTEDSKYYKDAQLILRCIYQNLDDIERGLVLSALIASGKKSGENEMTAGTAVGRGLKMFLQNKGPAFIKFGQLLSYLPSLDPDIRHELSTLRDKAKIPTRAELFDMLKTALPESEYQKISHVGKILGAGSFFVTVQVKYQDKDCVISLMRPHTQKLTQDGINMISNTIKDMTTQDRKFAVLKNIVTQARDSAYSEIDIEQDHQKYIDAIKIYESLTVHTPMGDYSPDVARWIAYGSAPNKNNAYKIMEMSPGEPLTSTELSEEEKHDMALAYTTLELSILLSGNKWDTDRHAGNQNFSNKAFREFCIGIFDTGAQMNSAPTRRDKRMIGYLLYLLIIGIRNGQNMSEILVNKVQDIDAVCKKLGISTAYIDGVQRGLTALSDIIQYQKEIRDDNGNIVQEAKYLTEQDMENIALAIFESGIIDKTLINTTKVHFILDRLAFWKQNRKPMSLEQTDNPISITVGPEIMISIKTNVINKAIEEIEKMLTERRAHEHLGVKKGITKKKDENINPSADYTR